MIASGGVQFDPNEHAAPAALRKSLSDSLGRVIDVLDVVLHDLDELTPAPTPAADTAVEVINEPLTRARDKFVSAKSSIDAAPEMTTDVFATRSEERRVGKEGRSGWSGARCRRARRERE